MKKILFVFFRM